MFAILILFLLVKMKNSSIDAYKSYCQRSEELFEAEKGDRKKAGCSLSNIADRIKTLEVSE